MSTEIVLVGIEIRMSGNRAIPRVAIEVGDLGLSAMAQDLKGLAEDHPKVLHHHFDGSMRHQFWIRDPQEFEKMLRHLHQIGVIDQWNNWDFAFKAIQTNPHLTWWIHIED